MSKSHLTLRQQNETVFSRHHLGDDGEADSPTVPLLDVPDTPDEDCDGTGLRTLVPFRSLSMALDYNWVTDRLDEAEQVIEAERAKLAEAKQSGLPLDPHLDGLFQRLTRGVGTNAPGDGPKTSRRKTKPTLGAIVDVRALPLFLTPEEVAVLLRKPSIQAVYADVERGRIPGVVRVGSRILFDREEFLRGMRAAQRRSR